MCSVMYTQLRRDAFKVEYFLHSEKYRDVIMMNVNNILSLQVEIANSKSTKKMHKNAPFQAKIVQVFLEEGLSTLSTWRGQPHC